MWSELQIFQVTMNRSRLSSGSIACEPRWISHLVSHLKNISSTKIWYRVLARGRAIHGKLLHTLQQFQISSHLWVPWDCSSSTKTDVGPFPYALFNSSFASTNKVYIRFFPNTVGKMARHPLQQFLVLLSRRSCARNCSHGIQISTKIKFVILALLLKLLTVTLSP